MGRKKLKNEKQKKKFSGQKTGGLSHLAALEAARADLEAALLIIKYQIWEIAKTGGPSPRARLECSYYGLPCGEGRLCTRFDAPCVGSYPDASIFPQDNDCFEPKND